MSDDQHSSPPCPVDDSIIEQPYREQQILQHEVNCWESAAAGPQVNTDSSWPGSPWEQAPSASSPAHSASAYAWCCEDDRVLTETDHRNIASFGGYNLDAWSPELSVAGSSVAIGICSAHPSESAAVLSSRPDQPRTCSVNAHNVSMCVLGVSAEDAAARACADMVMADELTNAQSAVEGHSGGSATAAASGAIVPALQTEQPCQETGLQPLQAVSGANNPQMVGAQDFMQLSMSRTFQEEGTQLRPPSISHAITAL